MVESAVTILVGTSRCLHDPVESQERVQSKSHRRLLPKVLGTCPPRVAPRPSAHRDQQLPRIGVLLETEQDAPHSCGALMSPPSETYVCSVSLVMRAPPQSAWR